MDISFTFKGLLVMAVIDQNMPGRELRVFAEEYPGSYYKKDLGCVPHHLGESGVRDYVKDLWHFKERSE